MSCPAFDDSRIKNNPDKRLLEYVTRYFKSFIDGDFAGMKALQTADFKITDIPLTIVKVNRDTWFDINKNFKSITTDTKVIAISLYGSSEPGHFSIMENLITFKLLADPPPQSATSLPPGAKAGDTVGMIMLSCLWWDEEGRVTRDLEYGRLTWENLDVKAWE
ncbi:hypothetical protein BGZ60DRAFT_515384 [Tricladium varicosporioides]|nr:hypothetical protein BGZ60DRAFT_515384 [Hymenoscyphus varicosporioides]